VIAARPDSPSRQYWTTEQCGRLLPRSDAYCIETARSLQPFPYGPTDPFEIWTGVHAASAALAFGTVRV